MTGSNQVTRFPAENSIVSGEKSALFLHEVSETERFIVKRFYRPFAAEMARQIEIASRVQSVHVVKLEVVVITYSKHISFKF